MLHEKVKTFKIKLCRVTLRPNSAHINERITKVMSQKSITYK